MKKTIIGLLAAALGGVAAAAGPTCSDKAQRDCSPAKGQISLQVPGVKFTDKRIDPKAPGLESYAKFRKLALEIANAYGYDARLSVDDELSELIRIRVAMVNQCSFCITLHTSVARERKINDARIADLASWWESDLYTPREKAALAYTDALNEGKVENFASAHAQAAKYFSPGEVGDLAANVINMVMFTRIFLAQGTTPQLVTN
jgi:AhpD family alkylhydroperoxidase